MLKMYHKTKANVSTPTNATTLSGAPQNTNLPQNTTTGKLLGIVTTIKEIYPVKNAKVTIFTGDYDDMTIVDSSLTDESGRTKTFVLPTPEKAISLNQNSTVLPYASYNMLVEADGYITNIHLNIPVFGTITSLQESNLLLIETAGEDKRPQVFDEAQKYDL